jgi:hypothetical protein
LTYRALEHGLAYNVCRNRAVLQTLPTEIVDFAEYFVIMQSKRYEADYDPSVSLERTSVERDIDNAAHRIRQFHSAAEEDKRAFAAHVLFRRRGAR